MFNKELEEIKRSQSIMNNAINEIKSTLEVTNNRITEVEDRINKVKRQRNTQQVKEHDKSPPNQTKEEEIGSLPEKEFRIMIVKMIQNLKTKWSYR